MIGDLIPSDLVRALRYVGMLNNGGSGVADAHLDAWIALTPPGEIPILGATSLSSGIERLLMQSRQYGGYLRSVGWADGSPLWLTDAGRAIVRAHEQAAPEATDAPEGLVILSPENPLNLVTLTGAVAAAKAGMLVDPYFKDDLFPWLMDATSIDRVLLCRAASERTVLELIAGAAEAQGRALEIRCLPPRAQHDRYLMAEDGAVSTIGASLNGLHKHFTTIAPVPEPGAAAVRTFLDAQWEAAEVVQAKSTLAAEIGDADD